MFLLVSTGIYASKNARKIPKEELVAAQNDWREVLRTLLRHIRAAAIEFKAAHGHLDSARNLGHALVELSESQEITYGESELLCEIHQVLRHGYESLTGCLCWLAYVIFRNKKVLSIAVA